MTESAERQTQLTLRVGGGQEQLKPIRLDAFESLSQHFSFAVDILSLGEIELLPTIGQPAMIESTLDGEHLRYFHGLIADAEFLEEVAGAGYVYRLFLSPAAHFHTHGSNYRIFQNKTLIDIVKTVLGECKIEYEVKASSGTRMLAYCVQFGESNFAFVSRLMEEEGLYYFYRHAKDAHTLVICDEPGSHGDLAGGGLIFNPTSGSTAQTDSSVRGNAGHYVQTWHERASSSAEAKVTLWDFDFKKPSASRKAVASGESAHPLDAVEVYDWPGRFYVESDGGNLSTVILEARRAERVRFEGSSHFAGIATGFHVALKQHPIGRYNRKYLVVRCRTVLSNEQYRSGGATGETFVDFTAIPSDVKYRAPQLTPRPIARGPETAVVTGPAGEEIHVDEFGRIKVQFHWDREGKLDDKTSCWVRVSQTGGLGNIIIPRIGHEVLVDFINGNPDRPIVVGRVFNADHMPVYPLPANKTRALWRTKTYKRDTGDSLPEAWALDTKQPGANELRFEDKTGAEELFIHAERDMNTRVRHNETHHTGRDVDVKVGKNRTEWVGKNETIDIDGDRKEHVKRTETVTVEKDRKVEIHSNDSLSVTRKIKIEAGTEIEIVANNKITLTVGGSSITLDPVSIKAATTMLKMDASASAKLSSALTNVEASGILTNKGGMVLIN